MNPPRRERAPSFSESYQTLLMEKKLSNDLRAQIVDFRIEFEL